MNGTRNDTGTCPRLIEATLPVREIRARAPKRGQSLPFALEAVTAVLELVAESLATPGAWIDLGSAGMALNECGQCSNGGLPELIGGTRVKRQAVMPASLASSHKR